MEGQGEVGSVGNPGSVADHAEAIRAEVQSEYAGKLAHAELRAQAAKDGISLPEGFTEYLNTSKLLEEDGSPSVKEIAKLLEPFQPKAPTYLQGIGLGRQGGYVGPSKPSLSLDARNR